MIMILSHILATALKSAIKSNNLGQHKNVFHLFLTAITHMYWYSQRTPKQLAKVLFHG